MAHANSKKNLLKPKKNSTLLHMRKRVTLFQIENLNQNKYLHLLIYDMHVLEMGQEQLVDRMSV